MKRLKMRLGALSMLLVLSGCCCGEPRPPTCCPGPAQPPMPSPTPTPPAAAPTVEAPESLTLLDTSGPIDPARVVDEAEDENEANEALLLQPVPGAEAAHTASFSSHLTLDDSFVQANRDRVTISVPFIVDAAKAHPNPVSSKADEGDLHVGGRSAGIGLPTVAEIMNAAMEVGNGKAVNFMQAKAGTGQAFEMKGAWRIWCEHGDNTTQAQHLGSAGTDVGGTNPHHVFEIHPITSVGGRDVSFTLKAIPGYTAYTSDRAFVAYNKSKVRLSHSAASHTLTVHFVQVGFNYTKYKMKVTSAPQTLADGVAIEGDVLLPSGGVVAQGVRMVSPAGSGPASRLGTAHVGDQLTVMGIPRLSLVKAQQIASGATSPTVVATPYEMIVVAVF